MATTKRAIPFSGKAYSMKLHHLAILITILALILTAGCVHYTDSPATPTETPTETVTAEPTITGTKTTTQTSTPKPQMTQMPNHQIDGSATMHTWEIWLDKGVSTISARNFGDGSFLVWLSKDGVRQDLLFNELNAYQGSAVFEIAESGFYTFDVVASGTWNLIIDGPYDATLTSYVQYRDNGVMFVTGSNSITSEKFRLEKGVTVFNGYYLGTGDISATLFANGVSAGRIDADITGPARTEIAYAAPVAGSYTIQVETAGAWGFEISQPIPKNPQAFTTIQGSSDTVTNYYEMTGNYLLSVSNQGTEPMKIVFYEADGKVAMEAEIPAEVSGYQYLFQNPNGYKTVVCLVAVTANGDWSIAPVRA